MSSDMEEFSLTKQLPIRRTNPDNIRPVYVNDFLISHSDKGEIFITFSLMETIGITDAEELNKIEFIEAPAISKLVLTTEFTERVVKVISRNLDTYKKKLKENDPE